MHNKNTTKTVVNDNTVVFETPTDFSNSVHLRQFGSVHWAHDKGVVNVTATKHKSAEWVEFDLTEDNLDTGHQKRVMFTLSKEEVEAFKKALNNL